VNAFKVQSSIPSTTKTKKKQFPAPDKHVALETPVSFCLMKRNGVWMITARIGVKIYTDILLQIMSPQWATGGKSMTALLKNRFSVEDKI
jgi:hypothetical protein